MTNQLEKKPAALYLLPALLGAVAGIAVFLWVYGTAPLHVSWDNWILGGYDELDVQQHYAGWLLFRNSGWSFPLGMADTIAIPDGTAISYTDSLPWVSIFLKLLRGVLPGTFQWFGLYVLGCFALQGAAGGLLCARGLTGRVQAAVTGLLGGALFACLPTLWERAFRHTALASQWLFLFALYVYLESRDALRRTGHAPRLRWWLVVLAFAAVGIHPYFLPLVMVCALLWCVDRVRLSGAWKGAAVDFVAALAAALVGGVLCGAIGTGSSLSRDGYGEFSMNLNALFNPYSRGQYTWSRLLPVLPQQSGQYDGFNYLGLGVLVLLAAALVVAVVTAIRRPQAAKAWWGRNWPVALACLLLTLFAVSNRVFWGNTGFTVPLPGWLLNLCGIFRSSGRMFYLPAACLVVWGVYTLRGACRRLPRPATVSCVLLAALLAVQVWDLSAVAAEKHNYFTETISQPVENVACHPMTVGIGAGRSALLAAGEVRDDRLRLLAILAGKEGLPTNLDIAVSGSHEAAAQSRADTAAQLLNGEYDPTAVYVTTDEAVWNQWQQVFADDPAPTFFVADSCYFMLCLEP